MTLTCYTAYVIGSKNRVNVSFLKMYHSERCLAMNSPQSSPPLRKHTYPSSLQPSEAVLEVLFMSVFSGATMVAIFKTCTFQNHFDLGETQKSHNARFGK